MVGKILLLVLGSILIAVGTILMASDPYSEFPVFPIILAITALILFFIGLATGPIGTVILFVLMGLTLGVMIFISFSQGLARALFSTILIIAGFILDIIGGVLIKEEYMY